MAMLRTLQPVLFVPPDQATAPIGAFAEALWRALGTAMRWWRAQLDCNVFQTLPLTELIGRHEAAWYFQSTQEKVAAELRALWPLGSDGITYICYGLWGEGPYQAPGNVIGASGDALVVQSSSSLVIFVEGAYPGYSRDEPWNSREAQTGALVHELGHTLGLPHTEDVEPGHGDESVMQAWWRFPDVGLTLRERQAVQRLLDRGHR